MGQGGWLTTSNPKWEYVPIDTDKEISFGLHRNVYDFQMCDTLFLKVPYDYPIDKEICPFCSQPPPPYPCEEDKKINVGELIVFEDHFPKNLEHSQKIYSKPKPLRTLHVFDIDFLDIGTSYFYMMLDKDTSKDNSLFEM